MPSESRSIARLAAVPLSVAFLIACGDPPTRPVDTPRPADQQVVAPESVSVTVETITHMPLGPDALGSQLEDPLLRELLAGIENSRLQASLEGALTPLTQRAGRATTAPFHEQVATAREVVAEALVDRALSADDAVALAVVQLALAGPSRVPESAGAPVGDGRREPARN